MRRHILFIALIVLTILAACTASGQTYAEERRLRDRQRQEKLERREQQSREREQRLEQQRDADVERRRETFRRNAAENPSNQWHSDRSDRRRSNYRDTWLYGYGYGYGYRYGYSHNRRYLIIPPPPIPIPVPPLPFGLRPPHLHRGCGH